MKRIALFILAVTLILTSAACIFASAEGEEHNVYFRIVWNEKHVKYASVSMTVVKYADAEATTRLDVFSFDCKARNTWERKVALENGYYQVVEVTPVNEYETLIVGQSDVFQVNGSELTVYVGIAPNGASYELPDPWVVDGHDGRPIWIWNKDNSADVSSGSEAESSVADYSSYYEDIFGDHSDGDKSDVEADVTVEPHSEAPAETSAEEQPGTSSQAEEGGMSNSSIALTIFLGLLIIGIVVFLLIRRKK